MQTAEAERLTLYCTEGGSDKVYIIWLQQVGKDWTVPFQFGPRGGTMQGGTKTPNGPVPQGTAQAIYAKIVREKKAKGYHEGEQAPAYTAQVGAPVDSGLRPMLLTAATEADLEPFIVQSIWAAQEKMNGKRILLRANGRNRSVIGVNRRGLECPIPVAVQKAMAGQTCALDGEMIGDRFFVFDLLERLAEGKSASGSVRDFRDDPLGIRFGQAEDLVLKVAAPSVLIVPLVVGIRGKRELVAQLRNARREGVVFKRLDGAYAPGRVASLAKAKAVKIKFFKSISVVVIAWNDKNSVEVGAYRGKTRISVGNVTVPDKYRPQIKPGCVIEVRYLYATTGDQLYQPNLAPDDSGSVVREDIEDRACLLSQLQYEGKEEKED